jgi:hypothetical protein
MGQSMYFKIEKDISYKVRPPQRPAVHVMNAITPASVRSCINVSVGPDYSDLKKWVQHGYKNYKIENKNGLSNQA